MPKSIVVSDDVFQMLQRLRGSGEPISEVIGRRIRAGVAQRTFFDVRTLTSGELDAVMHLETSAVATADRS